MNSFFTRRTAACSGALVLALGAGLFVPMSAQADGLDGLTGAINQTTAGASTVVSGTTAALSGSGSGSGSSSTTALVPAVVNTVTGVTDATGVTSNSSSSTSGTSTDVLGIPIAVGSPATQGSGAITVPGVVSVGTGTGVVDPVTGVVDGLLGGGTGGAGGAGGSGAGGITVTIGQQPDGGSVTSVNLGGTGTASGTESGSTSTTTNTTNTTNTTTVLGSDGSAAPTPSISAPTTTAPAPANTTAVAPATTTAVAKLLSLVASPSVGTVYPVKDGYRDDAVFRIVGATSTGKNEAVTGTAVLKRGTKQVATWTIGRSTQDLRWNGLDGGKVVPGAYALTAVVKDASGVAHTTTSKVTASKQRLVAATQRVNALSVSGKHVMAASARSGLSKGRVTLKVSTVATKVKGKQALYIVKNGKKLTIPIRKGSHTSKAITVPAAFTNFTLQHTWKKGQVKLKSIRYTYSYQTLR